VNVCTGSTRDRQRPYSRLRSVAPSNKIYIRTSNYVISQGQSVNGGLAAAPGDPKLNETYAKVALSKLGVAIQQAKQAAKAEKKAD
jgi:hypothetical protein